MDSKNVILIGGFSEIVELCELCQKNIVGIIDNNLNGKYLGYEIFGGDEVAPFLFKELNNVDLIVTPDIPATREKLVKYYLNLGFKFSSLISPKANISKSAKVGSGVIIQDQVNVSSMVNIGNYVKLNTYSNIMHNATIDDYVTVAPNAVVLGNAKICMNAYIGSNATVLPNVKVGSNAVVGAGAVVARNVDNDVTVVGVPARKLGGEK